MTEATTMAAAALKTLIVAAAARGIIPRGWCPIILRVMGLRHA